MYFFKTDSNGNLTNIGESYPKDERAEWNTRHDIRDLDHANALAKQATEVTGDTFVGVDNGPNVWPRFDLTKAPKVGDLVSYAFNGDYYPDGEVVKVSDSLRRVQTSTGNVYFRTKQTGSWRNSCWSLVPGHINERNPHF